ncbi:MAG: type I restriction-modification system subunit M [Chlorobium sp.]|uniref:type I restriction-modification system subunit M n=1 Tax=Chlorobium sp. TaxID=1095 RepID=UPI0025BC350C|nr:type I restriction-modification system subunit M [Chlorobium sp.]MCF8217186.1 type I restriction-modification system subunit M [Chlorobium sp.]MCF8272033.1 type I restriction-modification system subunit M [Chlorobium sp.]MCF8288404.1 type I restriction-modification system subunit M [Chlorobium sp.]MCF8292003.1 type I restriction-modification system subunit M [Chlorobium sp.]MCF8386111.1 type I restriction-modification system subunit M [Chlorobium sp.]
MTGKIDQKDINNAAWAACDTFRGVVDPSQYKDYILVMLFLKYISDVWQDHYEEYRKLYGDDDERILRKLVRERFVLPEVTLTEKDEQTGKVTVLDTFRATYNSLYERRAAANIGELINIVLDHIEEKNRAKLEGVFRNIDFNSEANLGKTKDRNRRLKQLLEDFHKPQLDMRPSRVSEDVIGNTYIYLIERFASDSGKKAGEFFTPLKVTELVARLAGPKPGDRICDPACGSGGLLIQAAKQVGDRNFALFGHESNGSTWALCRMNMFLHSFDSARIEWCDTLNSPLLVENDRLMKFNCVVANPPFSLDKWGAENAENDQYNRFWRGVPPKSKGDWAFISHMVETALEKEGRVAVVVPHGVLFRGAAEGRIRQKMIEENLLDAVIGLPGNLFPTTNIPVAILVFDRKREKGGIREECKNVLFVDASREYVSGKNQNTLSPEHLDRVMRTCKERKEVEKYAHVAEFAEIRENDFNLNIPRYVDTFEEEEVIDIDAVQREIDDLEKELVEVRRQMAEKLQQIQR